MTAVAKRLYIGTCAEGLCSDQKSGSLQRGSLTFPSSSSGRSTLFLGGAWITS